MILMMKVEIHFLQELMRLFSIQNVPTL